jgi:hypothetical protein
MDVISNIENLHTREKASIAIPEISPIFGQVVVRLA